MKLAAANRLRLSTKVLASDYDWWYIRHWLPHETAGQADCVGLTTYSTLTTKQVLNTILCLERISHSLCAL